MTFKTALHRGVSAVMTDPVYLPAADAPMKFSPNGDGFEIDADRGSIRIFADTPLAKRLAAAAIKEIKDDGIYVSAPDIAVRGVIEGFYGKPWSMEQRRRILSLIAKYGMNAYFYGPKDDPFHRDRWKELYGENDAATLRELIGISAENELNFSYMLAPGLTIRYTSEDDVKAMCDKYAQVYSFGVRRFGLLLDDIPDVPKYDEDKAAYPRLVDAHIYLANRAYDFLKRLDPENTLIVCPTQYWGDFAGEYVSALGKGVPADCEIFFTGKQICSEKLTREESETFLAATGHRPTYWDNYPVNDAEMVDEFHISPLTGRGADLFRCCAGLIFNPMEFGESSLISLITAAEYAWDNAGYDPQASYERAVTEVLGAQYVAPMKIFSDFCYKSCLTRHGHHFRYDAPSGFNSAYAAEKKHGGLSGYLRSALDAFAALRGCGNAAFLAEADRWLHACEAFAEAALARDPEKLSAYLRFSEDIMKQEASELLAEVK